MNLLSIFSLYMIAVLGTYKYLVEYINIDEHISQQKNQRAYFLTILTCCFLWWAFWPGVVIVGYHIERQKQKEDE